MLKHILQPALIISPYFGFSLDADRAADDIEFIAQVFESTPKTLKAHILNGSYNVTFDKDGVIVDCTAADHLGKKAFIQWQGAQRKHALSEDFYHDMLSHAPAEVRAERTGPLSVVNLATSRRLGSLPLSEAAQRLEILGDKRFMRFLSAEYPQIGSFVS
jgi:hypothetical protein